MTSDLNLSSQLGGVTSPTPTSSTESSAQTQETRQSDEISSSAQVAALIQMYTASTPVLYPPEAQIVGRLSSVRHDIIDNMLDKWIEQIRQLAKEAEEEALSPLSFRNTQEDAYKRDTLRSTLAETTRAVEATPEYQEHVVPHASKKTELVDLANGMEAARASGSNALTVLVPVVLFSDSNGNPITINNIDNMTNPSQLSFQLMTEQAVTSVANAADFAAQLGLIGALFMIPAMYQAELVAQADKGSKEPLPKDWKFAEAYDGQMREKVKGKEVDSWIRGMVLGHLPKSDVSPEQLIAMGKAILLCSALALYYRVESSRMTGKEFLDMLDGTMRFTDPVTKEDRPEDPRYELVAMINAYLDQIPSTDDRKNLKNALAEYMGKNPSLEDMIKPAKLFAGVLSRMGEPAESHEIAA